VRKGSECLEGRRLNDFAVTSFTAPLHRIYHSHVVDQLFSFVSIAVSEIVFFCLISLVIGFPRKVAWLQFSSLTPETHLSSRSKPWSDSLPFSSQCSNSLKSQPHDQIPVLFDALRSPLINQNPQNRRPAQKRGRKLLNRQVPPVSRKSGMAELQPKSWRTSRLSGAMIKTSWCGANVVTEGFWDFNANPSKARPT
jgi:hypothetical protein